MAITPYTKPANLNLINTYVPIPFEAMMAAGQVGQKRIEDVEQIQDTIDTALGQVKGLNYLPSLVKGVPGQEVKGQELVDKRANYYRDKVGQILKENPNLASSIEAKVKLRGVLNELKKDIGPTGVFGTQAANVETFNKYQEMLQKDKDWKNNEWTAIQIQQAWDDFANKINSGQNAQMYGYAPILNKANPIELMAKSTLNKLKDVALERGYKGPFPKEGDIEGWKMLVKEVGIPIETLNNAIKLELANNQELRGVLQNQSMYDAYASNREAKDVMKDKLDLLKTQVLNTYYAPKEVEKWLKVTDAEGNDNGKKVPILTSKLFATIKSPIADYKMEDVLFDIGTTTNQLANAQSSKQEFLNNKGITDERLATGNDKVMLNYYNSTIETLSNKLDYLNEANEKALESIGVKKGSKEYKELFDLAKQRYYTAEDLAKAEERTKAIASNKYDSGMLALASLFSLTKANKIREGIKSGNLYLDKDGVVRHAKGPNKDEPIKDVNLMDKMFGEFMNVNYKKYNEFIENQYGAKPITTKISTLPKNIASNDLIKNPTSRAYDWKTGSYVPYNIDEGKKVTPEEWNNLQIENAQMIGLWFNPATNRQEIAYSVPTGKYIESATGKRLQRTQISLPTPGNIEAYLAAAGLYDQVEMLATQQLMSEFNNPYYLVDKESKIKLGNTSTKEDNLALRSMGYTGVPLNDEGVVSQFDVKYNEPSENNPYETWDITTEFDDGKPDTITLYSMDQVISWIAKKHAAEQQQWAEEMDRLTREANKKKTK